MAVKIRLKRTGRRNRPFYRICVFDGRTRRDGKPVEELGSYDPRAKTWAEKITLNRQRAHYWLTVGAQPSETVASILRKFEVRKDGPVPEGEPAVVTAAAAATPAAEPAKTAAPAATATAVAEPAAEAAPADEAPAADDAATDDTAADDKAS